MCHREREKRLGVGWGWEGGTIQKSAIFKIERLARENNRTCPQTVKLTACVDWVCDVSRRNVPEPEMTFTTVWPSAAQHSCHVSIHLG